MMNDDLPRCRRLAWRLRVMMAERNIRTITELAHRLGERGVDISTQQLTRVVNDMPSRLSMELLSGLVEVLRCGVEDIIMVLPAPDAEPKAARGDNDGSLPNPPRAPRRRRPKNSGARESAADENSDLLLTGPVVTPFLLPEPKS